MLRNLMALGLVALMACLIAFDVEPSDAASLIISRSASVALQTDGEDGSAEVAEGEEPEGEAEVSADEAPADSGEMSEEEMAAEDQKSLLPWYTESPHWEHGQPFSAVNGAGFIGSAECVLCHEELKFDFLHTAHARSLTDDKTPLDRQGCEMCHGAGGAHASLRSRGTIFAFDWSEPEQHNVICLRCHEWMTSEHEWHGTTHAEAGLRCTQCHDPHQAHSEQASNEFLLLDQQDRMCAGCHQDVARDFTRFSHHPVQMNGANDPGATGMHCTGCHDVHAGKGHAMLPTARVTDTCVKCHLDKAGPFRFVHMATEEGIGQGCLACHAQHGSSSESLLVADGRALCMQCHTDRQDHYQPLTCWATGCHEDMHGSNHNLMFLRQFP